MKTAKPSNDALNDALLNDALVTSARDGALNSGPLTGLDYS